jgi:hypothetical protein
MVALWLSQLLREIPIRRTAAFAGMTFRMVGVGMHRNIVSSAVIPACAGMTAKTEFPLRAKGSVHTMIC